MRGKLARPLLDSPLDSSEEPMTTKSLIFQKAHSQKDEFTNYTRNQLIEMLRASQYAPVRPKI